MGDRQKAFEVIEAGRRLVPGVPAIVRLDGRAFHTFTRGLLRPYDERLSRSMIETTKFLVKETHASVGYTQSDEISLAFPNIDSKSEMMFNGKVQKLCSVLASLATAKFNFEIAQRIPEKAHCLPVFDARVWSLPNLDTAAEYFRWREADATRNSLTMAAHAYYGHKELHKVGHKEKHDMLHAKGINWNDYPAFFKRGVYVRRESMLRELTPEELSKIPEKHRPVGPVHRTVLSELDLPPFDRIANMKDVLFLGAQPVSVTEQAVV